MQLQTEVLFRAGKNASCVVAHPGVHGEVVAGMHGMGVNTPSAADVAAATCGFASDVHIPNVPMFTSGM